MSDKMKLIDKNLDQWCEKYVEKMLGDLVQTKWDAHDMLIEDGEFNLYHSDVHTEALAETYAKKIIERLKENPRVILKFGR